MSRRYLLDTGAWIALLVGDDKHHSWSRKVIPRLPAPLRTCEAVVSETCFLLGRNRSLVMAMISKGAVEVPFRLSENLGPTEALMAKYSDIPMALADACLVRMAELDAGATVITCDGDFNHYRKHRSLRVPLLMPE